jgi:hypothetical protein
LQGPDPAQVRLPAPLGVVVGVADIVAHLGPFAANIADKSHGECSFLQNFYLTQIYKKSKKMWKKIFSSFGVGLLFPAMLLMAAPLRSAEPISYSQEAALFSLADLGQVDMSPKRVVVEMYASPTSELNSFHRLLPQAWSGVRTFYARLGVLLEMVPGGATPGSLEAGKRLRFEALTHKEWLAATFKAFQVAPPFRLRF